MLNKSAKTIFAATIGKSESIKWGSLDRKMSEKIKRYRKGRRIYIRWDSSTKEVKVLPKPKPKQPQSEITLDKEIPPGKFSNMFAISSSESEFIMDFMQLQNNKAKVHTRVISTPKLAKRLCKALEENIKKYEEKWGS